MKRRKLLLPRIEGKIGQTMLGIIHVMLLTTIQYLLRHVLQTKLHVILDTVVYRHTTVP